MTRPLREVTVTINLYDDATISDQAKEIMGQITPHVLKSFLDKNADYGDTSFELGLAGQYAELWRKVGKLKGPMWEGKDDLKFEGMEEIISDLIGHCLLSLYFIRNNKP